MRALQVMQMVSNAFVLLNKFCVCDFILKQRLDHHLKNLVSSIERLENSILFCQDPSLIVQKHQTSRLVATAAKATALHQNIQSTPWESVHLLKVLLQIVYLQQWMEMMAMLPPCELDTRYVCCKLISRDL